MLCCEQQPQYFKCNFLHDPSIKGGFSNPRLQFAAPGRARKTSGPSLSPGLETGKSEV